ncbi:hypothetical protein FRB94_007355 [Tulasnella sp. JGI-2019a]|nr:hypothetical protein FRB94_007355 [Tulasnella sp. JGI-2019a]
MIRSTLISTALLAVAVRGQVAVYGQCGGINYTGSTTCAAGSVCTYQNDYYSQCVPGTATTTSTTSKATTTSTTSTTSKATTSITSTTSSKATTTSTTSTTSSKATTTTTSAVSTATGYVKTSGTSFLLNGSPFTLVGENAYWIPQYTAQADIDQAFSDIAGMGATTVRTWGFNEVLGDPGYGTWYQSWTNGVPTFNAGSNGQAQFTIVVASAKAHGIKLIVALTNNWSDYGGMDVYVSQLLGSTSHDLFYSNPTVIAAFKNYIKEFITPYINEPTILAWELANEPRCAGSTGVTSGTCTSTTISTWVSTISAYIKSLDSNHLVTLGDEGFGMDGSTDYVYSYGIGTNYTADLALSTIDFGTFHLYPGSWGETADPVGFGNTWITAHVAVGNKLNKPVILEEFGVTSNQTATYWTWLNTGESGALAGWLIWQAGSHLSGGDTYNDGYAIYPDTAGTYTLLTCESAAYKARNAGTTVTACPLPST